MKPYYVMLQFCGPYVTGLVVPQARDEKHAIQQLKLLLWAQLKVSQSRPDSINRAEDRDPDKIRELLRSLKRPWRLNGDYRGGGKKSWNTPAKNAQKVVKVMEMKLPVFSGYWLSDILQGHLCNQHSEHWTEPSKITAASL